MSLKTKARNTIQEICRICKEESKLFLFFALLILIFLLLFSFSTGIKYVNRISQKHWESGFESWSSYKYDEALSDWKISLLISSFTRKEHARYLYWNAKAERKTGNKEREAKLIRRLEERYPCSYYGLLAEERDTYLTEREKSYFTNRYPRKWEKEIRSGAAEFGVPAYTVWAIIKQESKFRKNALSRTGAVGLMQLMPETASHKAEKIGMERFDLKNPADNVRIGTSYFRYLLSLTDENIIISLACYNAGRQAVRNWGKLQADDWEEWIERIPYPQTYQFVRNVLANNEMYYKIYYYDERIPGMKGTLRERMDRLEFPEVRDAGREQGDSDDRENSTGL